MSSPKIQHDPSLLIDVTGVAGRPESTRSFSGRRDVSLRVGDSTVSGPMLVEGTVRGSAAGVGVDFTASAEASLECVRCLRRWSMVIEVEARQLFSATPDEDGYAISDGLVDVSGPATDEVALAIPMAPLCRPDCRGLCPSCGTDLNTAPCDGHEDDSDSPFSVLKDLFDP